MGRFCHLETFFGIEGSNNNSLIGLEGGVDEQLSGKCTLVGSGAENDEVVLLVDIISLTSLLMLSKGGNMLLIMAR